VTFQEFTQFFRKVHPELTTDEAHYVFKRTDKDDSGSISIEELQTLLADNGIKLNTQF
jgi:Ca2+-binding EF-hand superfamily protein